MPSGARGTIPTGRLEGRIDCGAPRLGTEPLTREPLLYNAGAGLGVVRRATPGLIGTVDVPHSTGMATPLISKYNVPGPRYTSYPTVPYWDATTFSASAWIASVRRAFSESNRSDGIALYVHLPFCEKLCTFCGCTKRVTRNHAVESPYVETVLSEWSQYLALFGDEPRLRELHYGGGTPTFFSPENLQRLTEGILSEARLCPDFEFGFEANPMYTRRDHLDVLYALGARRLSLGVQDFDPRVQDIINRVQPYESVAAITRAAREVGYQSIGFDLVYGLPLQELASVTDTVEKVVTLRPDRIAYYSYAHVPWIKGVGQRKFSERDLPRDELKRLLYETGRDLLEAAGYREIGMDHFALESDALYRSARERRLHRNFMGYTPVHTQLSIGLGMSSIGDTWYAFAQNEKTVDRYRERVAAAELPVFRGHVLGVEDLILRRHILNVMCRLETSWRDPAQWHPVLDDVLPRLVGMADDGLLRVHDDGLTVTPAGRPFIRNICMAFDARLWRRAPDTQLFSQTI